MEFGIWNVVKDRGLVGNLGNREYLIEKERLWETTNYSGETLWDWLIHLSEKAWITSNNINDLNTAFIYAQDYFRDEAPNPVPQVSIRRTLEVQAELLENRDSDI